MNPGIPQVADVAADSGGLHVDRLGDLFFRPAFSPKTHEDECLTRQIAEIHEANYCAYGYRRMWIALQRAGEEIGRGRVARLMGEAGIQGAKRRGRPWRTTTPDPAALRRPDLVCRDFSAAGPDRLY